MIHIYYKEMESSQIKIFFLYAAFYYYFLRLCNRWRLHKRLEPLTSKAAAQLD
jgi:hypothetical protein